MRVNSLEEEAEARVWSAPPTRRIQVVVLGSSVMNLIPSPRMSVKVMVCWLPSKVLPSLAPVVSLAPKSMPQSTRLAER